MIINLHKFLLLENVKQAKKILKDKGLNPEKEKDYQGIVKQLSKVPNLISKFVKFRYEEGIEIEGIKRVMDWMINNRQLVSKLPKNVLKYDKFEHLEDDITRLNREQKIKKFYNSLYRSMKNQIDNLESSRKDIFDNLAVQFMNMSEEKQKQFTPLKYFEVNNITIKQFIDALSNFINKNSINSDQESILKKIKKYQDSVDITFFSKGVLVIQTNDKKAICDLGSTNWCIVYASKSYAEGYFGIKTHNSQYIVFNFNLPSSASNSMFGITIKEDGIVSAGGSQNKTNNYIPLDEVIKLTGLPGNVLVPAKKVLDTSKKYEDVITKIKDQNSLIKAIQILKDNDLINYISKNDFLKISHIINKFGNEVSNMTIWLLNDINDYKDENKIDELWTDYPEILDYIDYAHIISALKKAEIPIENIIYFMYVCHVKDDSDVLFQNSFELHIELNIDNFNYFIKIKEQNKYEDLIKNFDKVYNAVGKKSTVTKDGLLKLLIRFINDYIDKFIKNVLSGSGSIDLTFTNYLKFFNKYASGYKYPSEKYEDFFNDYIYDVFFKYLDDLYFIQFIKDHIEDYTLSLDTFMDNDSYDAFDNYDYQKKLVELYEMKNNDGEYVESTLNSIEKLFLYKEGSKRVTLKEVEESLDINRNESGKTYITMDSFNDLDDYFEGEPFTDMDELHEPYWSDMTESDIVDFLDMIDDDNIIEIANLLHKNEIYNFEELKKYAKIKDSGDEESLRLFKSIKDKVIECLEDYTEYDVSDILNWVNRSLDDVVDMLQRDETWKYAFDQIKELFGSIPLNDKYVYDWQEQIDLDTVKIKSHRLMLSINIFDLISNISFNTLYYNQGDNPDWEGIINNQIEQEGKLSVNYDYINPWVSNSNKEQRIVFNERLADSISYG